MTLRPLINLLRRRWLHRLLFRPLFGERSQGVWLPHTRISPATCIEHEERLTLGDHVYIGPFNLIEASGGIVIEEGVQITSHCALVTHSSHRSMRLLGPAFVLWGQPGGLGEAWAPRPGWIAGPIHIGAYSFIGPHCLIEAGSTLGRGSIVCAGTQLRGSYTDFAVLEGNPARVVGDSRVRDEKLLAQYPELRALYDAWAAPERIERMG